MNTAQPRLFANGFHLVSRVPPRQDTSSQVLKQQIPPRYFTSQKQLEQVDDSVSDSSSSRRLVTKANSKQINIDISSPASASSFLDPRTMSNMHLSPATSASGTRFSSRCFSKVSKPTARMSSTPRQSGYPIELSPLKASLSSVSSESSTGRLSSSSPTSSIREEDSVSGQSSNFAKPVAKTRKKKRMNIRFNFEQIDKYLEKGQAHLDIERIFCKDPESRSPEELAALTGFLKTIKFFEMRDISDEDLAELSANFKVACLPAGSDAVVYGEEGNEFYIILKGQVEAFVPNSMIKGWRHERFRFLQDQTWKKSIDEQYSQILMREVQQRELRKQRLSLLQNKLQRASMAGGSTPKVLRESTFLSAASSRKSEIGNMTGNSPSSVAQVSDGLLSLRKVNSSMDDMAKKLGLTPEQMKRYRRIEKEAKTAPKWFIPVTTLKAGQSFGEVALMTNQARSATITCTEECVFATIHRSSYEAVLGQIEHKNFVKKTNFFKQQPFLQHWTGFQVAKVIHSFYEVVFTFGQVVFKQGAPSDFIYIVKEGQLAVTRNCILTRRKLQPGEEKAGLRTFLSPRQEEMTFKPPMNPAEARRALKPKTEQFEVQLKYLLPGQIFGEEDAFGNRPRATTVKCSSSKAVVYSIKKAEFLNKFGKDERIWRILSANIKSKSQLTRGNAVSQLKMKRGTNIPSTYPLEPPLSPKPRSPYQQQQIYTQQPAYRPNFHPVRMCLSPQPAPRQKPVLQATSSFMSQGEDQMVSFRAKLEKMMSLSTEEVTVCTPAETPKLRNEELVLSSDKLSMTSPKSLTSFNFSKMLNMDSAQIWSHRELQVGESRNDAPATQLPSPHTECVSPTFLKSSSKPMLAKKSNWVLSSSDFLMGRPGTTAHSPCRGPLKISYKPPTPMRNPRMRVASTMKKAQ